MIYIVLILFFVFLILIVPVKIGINLLKNDNTIILMYVSFCWDLLSFKIFQLKSERKIHLSFAGMRFFKYKLKKSDKIGKKPPEPVKEDKKKEVGKKKRKKIKDFIKLIRNNFEPLMRYFKRVMKSISLDKLDLEGMYGIENHYYSGFIYGIVCAVRPFYPEKINIDLHPLFNENIFYGRFRMRFSIYLYKMMVSTFIFLIAILRLKIKEK